MPRCCLKAGVYPCQVLYTAFEVIDHAMARSRRCNISQSQGRRARCSWMLNMFWGLAANRPGQSSSAFETRTGVTAICAIFRRFPVRASAKYTNTYLDQSGTMIVEPPGSRPRSSRNCWVENDSSLRSIPLVPDNAAHV